MIGHTWAFDVHKVRVWRLHKSLELVPLFFGFLGGVEKIDGERLSSDCQHTVGVAETVDDVYHVCEEG